MKTINLILALSLIVATSSCRKELEVIPPTETAVTPPFEGSVTGF